MKEYVKTGIIVVLCLFVGGLLQRCVDSAGDRPFGNYATEMRDTVTVRDTLRIVSPAVSGSTLSGYMDVTLPRESLTDEGNGLPNSISDNDTLHFESGNTALENDSVKVRLPIEQNIYEGEDYKAYVSGVYASLDSLFVYPKREILTIKKPPKKWHIGPTIGYGYTPEGFQPYIGVSVTYSIISF